MSDQFHGFRESRHEPATKGRLDLEPSGRAVIIDGGGPGNGRAPESKGPKKVEVNRMASVLASVRLASPSTPVGPRYTEGQFRCAYYWERHLPQGSPTGQRWTWLHS